MQPFELIFFHSSSPEVSQRRGHLELYMQPFELIFFHSNSREVSQRRGHQELKVCLVREAFRVQSQSLRAQIISSCLLWIRFWISVWKNVSSGVLLDPENLFGGIAESPSIVS